MTATSGYIESRTDNAFFDYLTQAAAVAAPGWLVVGANSGQSPTMQSAKFIRINRLERMGIGFSSSTAVYSYFYQVTAMAQAIIDGQEQSVNAALDVLGLIREQIHGKLMPILGTPGATLRCAGGGTMPAETNNTDYNGEYMEVRFCVTPG